MRARGRAHLEARHGRRRPAAIAAMLAAACLLAVGLPSASGSGTEVVDEIHYTFTGPNSVAFDWRGAATDIRYGTDVGYGSTATGSQPSPLPWSSDGPFREVELSGLTPGT